VKQFNPSKTIIKKTEIVLNDGTCTFLYEAIEVTSYDFTKLFLLLIPFVGWFIFIAYTGLYFDTRFESLGEFDSLQDAQKKIDKNIEGERQQWLKKELHRNVTNIKYP